MSFTDDAKAVIALTTRLGVADRPSLSPTRWHQLSVALGDAGASPADLFAEHGATGVTPPSLQSPVNELLATASAATVAAAELQRKGIWTLTIVDDDYPDPLRRLGSNAPPVVFGAGSQALLQRGGIAVVGSRNITEAGAHFAAEVAAEAVKLGMSVISGGARGVDQIAMNTAYQGEGSVVGVLADSLDKRIRAAEIIGAIDRGDVCLITQQVPTVGFSVGAAMARNKLIYALADLTVVVASDQGTGGTWAGAGEALKRGYGAVAVRRGDDEGSGNAAIQDLGATPIRNAEEIDALLGSDGTDRTDQLSILDPS